VPVIPIGVHVGTYEIRCFLGERSTARFDVRTSLFYIRFWKRNPMARAPGSIRDAIIEYLSAAGQEASIAEIREGIRHKLGDVAPSSVRSYLNLNVPNQFERTGRGEYRLKKRAK
jgi:hypothetical protein